MKQNHLFLLVFLILLSACGGGQSDDPYAGAPAALHPLIGSIDLEKRDKYIMNTPFFEPFLSVTFTKEDVTNGNIIAKQVSEGNFISCAQAIPSSSYQFKCMYTYRPEDKTVLSEFYFNIDNMGIIIGIGNTGYTEELIYGKITPPKK